jgi:hypothetical protein
MPISYSLAPIPFWQFTDNAGKFAAGGYLETFAADNHTQQKAIYSDPAGTIPYSNPVILDSAGRIGPIYFADDAPYYITVTDASSLLIFEVDNYSPPASGGAPITEVIDFQNYIINSQFREFYNTFSNPLPASVIVNIAPPSWQFYKNGIGSNDVLSFIRPILGTSPPDLTPTYILEYSEAATPTGETRKDILYTINDVNSFQNQQTSFSFFARSDVTIVVEYGYIQFFGTGGSATNEVLVDSVQVTSAWTRFTFDGAIIDTVFGKTVGSTQDTFSLFIRLPQNTPIQLFNLSDIQFQITEAATPFIYESSTQVEALTSETNEVKVSLNDTNAGFLAQKLVAGDDIGLTIINPSSNETLSVSYTGRKPILYEYTYVPIPTSVSITYPIQNIGYNLQTDGFPDRSLTTLVYPITYTVINNCNLKVRHRAKNVFYFQNSTHFYVGIYLSTGTQPLGSDVVRAQDTSGIEKYEGLYEIDFYMSSLTAATILQFEVRIISLPAQFVAHTFRIGTVNTSPAQDFTFSTFFEFTEYLP